jgi:carbon monoxide dehydrogenase subunit G
MPVQQAVDVAAPIDVVYDQFTQFEDWPKFMHRVERVEQTDDAHVVFHEKVWVVRRQWEAEIVEQRPDERIVWKSVSGLSHTGVVTFHDLAERLTRIELNIDVDPEGPVEKLGRGLRFVKRAARADLKRFKAYVEMHEDETGAWRGEIQEGEVVAESDDDQYEDEYDDEDYVDEEGPEAEYEDEEPEEADEDEDEDEDEEERPRRGKARTAGRSSRSKRSSSSKSTSSSARGRGSGSSSRKSSGSSSRSRSRSSGSSSKSKSSSSRSRGSSGSSRSKSSSPSRKSSGGRGKSGSSRSKSSSGSRKS